MKCSLLTQSILAALAAVGTAEAATITLNTTASGMNNADGLCSLAEAIDNANDDAPTHADCAPGSGADTIELPAAQVITLQERLPLIDSDVTFAGNQATVDRDTSVVCSEVQDPGRFGLFAIDSSTVTFQSMAMRYGCESYDGANAGLNVDAHGIAASNSTVRLQSVELFGNSGGTRDGGAVAIRGGSLDIQDSQIAFNAGVGGGVSVRSADLTVSRSTLEDNYGDAFATGRAGGLAVEFGSATIIDSQITNNAANGAEEGGAVFANYSTLSILRSTISGNQSRDAGAIFAVASDVYIEDSELSSNTGTTATSFSALYFLGLGSAPVLSISNSTVSGNTGGRSPLYIYGASRADLYDSTFVDNSGASFSILEDSPFSGGTTFNLRRNIFSAATGTLCGFQPGTTVNTSNNVATDSSCGSAYVTTNTALALGPLQNNGGLTDTHAITPASVAYDAAGQGCAGTDDQRGARRPAGAACDAGAFEYQPRQSGDLIVNEITDDGDGLCTTDYDCTLREAIIAANANSDLTTISFAQRVFDLGGVVSLTEGSLAVMEDVTIVGAGVKITRDSALTCDLNNNQSIEEFRHFTMNGADVALTDLTLSNGCADGQNVQGGTARGGSVMITGGSLALSMVSLAENQSRGTGGALAVRGGATASIDGSYFARNSASSGGAGVFYTINETISISNSTFVDNQSPGYGGVAYMGIGSTVSVNNSTFAENSGGQGGVFFNYGGTLTVNDSTAYNNTVQGSGQFLRNYSYDVFVPQADISRSVLVGSGSQCVLAGNATVSDTISTSACGGASVYSQADINLGPIGDNGGDTPTFLPQPGSVLIDAASGCAGTDQRGIARAQDADGLAGGDCDIGAVEVVNILLIALADGFSVSEDAATLNNTDVDGSANADPSDDGVLVNDFDSGDDEDSGALTVVGVNTLSIDDLQTSQTIAFPSGAELTLNQDGSFSFDGLGDFEFLADGEVSSQAATVAISDGLASATAPLVVDVVGANDLPVASDTAFDATEDLTASFAFPGTDADASDNLTFAFDAFSPTFSNNNDGSFEFDGAQPGFQSLGEGETTTVTAGFTVSDAFGSDGGTISIIVSGQNDAPQAFPIAEVAANEDAPVSGNFNGSDVDDLVTQLTFDVIGQPSPGILTPTLGTGFDFDPNGGFEGLADGESTVVNFTYRVTDPGGLSSVGTGTIRVAGANDAPVANEDAYSTERNQSLAIDALSGLLANDSDVDSSDTLSVVLGSVVNTGIGGALVAAADGSFTYTPPTDASGLDSFEYRVTDGEVEVTGTVVIRVGLENQPPVAVDDDYAIDENGALTVPAPGVLDNDSDPESNPLTVNSAGTFTAQGIGGSITVNADGSVNYTPPSNTSGQASLLYTVTDGFGNVSDAVITIDVTNIDDAPNANDDLFSPIAEDTPNRVITVTELLANDDAGAGDAEDSVSVVSVTAIAGASAVLDDFGTPDPVDDIVSIVPLANYFGDVEISYTIEDEAGTPATAKLRFPVTPVNDPPVFTLDGDRNFGSGTVGVQVFNNFANVISLGPNELNQMVQRIDVTATSDSNGVVDLATINDVGQIALVLSGNEGEATFDVTVTDNGGIANGGEDTADSQSFTVRVGDTVEAIFSDRFEAATAAPAITKRYAAGQANLSRDELLSRVSSGGGEVTVLEAIGQGEDVVRFAMVDARLENGELQIRIRGMDNGTLTLGVWTSVEGGLVTVEWL